MTLNCPYIPSRLWNYTALLLPPFVFRNVLSEFPLLLSEVASTLNSICPLYENNPKLATYTQCISRSLPIAPSIDWQNRILASELESCLRIEWMSEGQHVSSSIICVSVIYLWRYIAHNKKKVRVVQESIDLQTWVDANVFFSLWCGEREWSVIPTFIFLAAPSGNCETQTTIFWIVIIVFY